MRLFPKPQGTISKPPETSKKPPNQSKLKPNEAQLKPNEAQMKPKWSPFVAKTAPQSNVLKLLPADIGPLPEIFFWAIQNSVPCLSMLPAATVWRKISPKRPQSPSSSGIGLTPTPSIYRFFFPLSLSPFFLVDGKYPRPGWKQSQRKWETRRVGNKKKWEEKGGKRRVNQMVKGTDTVERTQEMFRSCERPFWQQWYQNRLSHFQRHFFLLFSTLSSK